MGGTFPYFAIFDICYEDKVNSYNEYSVMQMGLFYKPCKNIDSDRKRDRDRKRDLMLSLPDSMITSSDVYQK